MERKSSSGGLRKGLPMKSLIATIGPFCRRQKQDASRFLSSLSSSNRQVGPKDC